MGYLVYRMIQQVVRFWQKLRSRLNIDRNPEREVAEIHDAFESGDDERVLEQTRSLIVRERSLSSILRRQPVRRTRMFHSSEEYNNYLRKNPGESYVSWEFPTAPEAHYHRFLVFRRSGRLLSSREEIENSLAEFPESAKYHLELGMILQEMGQRSQAEVQYKLALRNDLTEDLHYARHARLQLAELHMERGKWGKARRTLLTAYASSHGDSDILTQLRLLSELESDPRQQVEFFLVRGNFSRVVSCAREALRHDPDDYEMNMALAFAHKELQRWDMAEKCVRRAYRSNPRAAQANFALGWICLFDDRVEQAEAEFRAAVRKNPHEPAFLIGVAYTLLEQYRNKNLPELRREFFRVLRNASELDRESAEPHLARAEFYFSENDYQKARAAAAAAVAAQPNLQAAHVLCAEIYLELRDFRKAAYHLREASEFGPDTEEMRELMQRLRRETF